MALGCGSDDDGATDGDAGGGGDGGGLGDGGDSPDASYQPGETVRMAPLGDYTLTPRGVAVDPSGLIAVVGVELLPASNPNLAP